MARYLPLFPLNTVLFPGGSLDLRIFEPRYKTMLKECLDADRRFGVVLIKSGDEAGGHAEPYTVGTVAHISNISAPDRGGLPVEVLGERRFKIVSLDHSRPFLAAQVETYDDAESLAPPSDLVRHAHKAAREFVSIMLAARGVWASSVAVPSEPMALSYFMGIAAAEAPLKARQKLLEADSLTRRLQTGIALLEEEMQLFKPAIMRSGPGAQESRFSSN